MSGALQAVFQNQRSFIPPLPNIGDAYEGGYFAGQISTAGNGIPDYNLVVGPVSSSESRVKWKNATTATAGADSNVNGSQNTADMVADGNATVYPAAHFCNDLSTGGQTDWYMPANNELEICYYNLKPTTTNNNTSSGINANAIPARASNYTTGTPAQTSVAIFQTGGAQAFNATPDSSWLYWTSTEFQAAGAKRQYFNNGKQLSANYKSDFSQVRAIRRVAV